MPTAPFFDPSRPSMGSQQPFGFFGGTGSSGGGATTVLPPTGQNPAGNPQQGGGAVRGQAFPGQAPGSGGSFGGLSREQMLQMGREIGGGGPVNRTGGTNLSPEQIAAIQRNTAGPDAPTSPFGGIRNLGGPQGFVPPSLAVQGQQQFPGQQQQFPGQFPGQSQGGFNPQFGQSQLGGDVRSGLATGLHNVTNRAEDLFRAGPRPFFPGQTVAGFNPFQNQAAQGAFQAAGQSAPLNQAAMASAFGSLNPFAGGNFGAGQLGQFARGDFVGQNPFIQDVFNQQIAPSIRENVNTPFLQGGRFGSAANTRTLGRELGNAATNLFGANFAEEQRNRLNASGQLSNLGFNTQGQVPGLLGGQLQNQGQLFDFGSQFQQQQQNEIQGARERFEFGRDDPSRRLQELFGFLNPQNIGQFQNATAPNTSRAADIAGGVGSGLGILSQFNDLSGGGIGRGIAGLF